MSMCRETLPRSNDCVCSDGATLVTYGGMSKHPMVLPYEVLAYKDLALKGFWVTAWAKKHSKEERAAMINDIADMIRRCALSGPFQQCVLTVWLTTVPFAAFVNTGINSPSCSSCSTLTISAGLCKNRWSRSGACSSRLSLCNSLFSCNSPDFLQYLQHAQGDLEHGLPRQAEANPHGRGPEGVRRWTCTLEPQKNKM